MKEPALIPVEPPIIKWRWVPVLVARIKSHLFCLRAPLHGYREFVGWNSRNEISFVAVVDWSTPPLRLTYVRVFFDEHKYKVKHERR